MSLIDRRRIRQAQALFSVGSVEDEEPHTIVICFERLGAEILTRAIALGNLKDPPPNLEQVRLMARLFRHSFLRISDVFLRLEHINWLQAELGAKADEGSAAWQNFAALAIKDFHMDLFSLMDSVAPVVIQATGQLKRQDQKKLPGFADIQKYTKRSYRRSIPTPVTSLIDATDRWWTLLKQIRNTLAHNEHERIVFGNPSQGILFQIYQPHLDPMILDPDFMWPTGERVVDFGPYSAFVVAELLLFLDELGSELAGQMNLSTNSLTRSIRSGDFGPLLETMEKLSTGGKPSRDD